MTYSCEFEDFSGKIFEDGGNVDSGLSSNSHLVLRVVFQEALDTTTGELLDSMLAWSIKPQTRMQNMVDSDAIKQSDYKRENFQFRHATEAVDNLSCRILSDHSQRDAEVFF